MGEDLFRGRNHALPVLQELKYEGLTFVVSEGLAFCHKRLVAHLDVSYDNILVNFAGGINSPRTSAFRSKQYLSVHFPVRYYINGFEHAAVFFEDSKPSERTITGLPNACWGSKKEYFTRRVPPEMGNAEPYCPFRADHIVELKLWDDEAELHRMTVKTKAASTALRLLILFKEMSQEIPTQRPLMAEVYETLQTIIRETDQAAQEHYAGIYLPRESHNRGVEKDNRGVLPMVVVDGASGGSVKM
ncbi:uncharacterized protein BT62DRAFT_919926 [Guyanagaster necrorhizus]|uniref:Uncharacterized protein n=1 Tax=Guyanagaster necrorhizus TaxID=856835 RepID=A0A9P8AT73_9AGAR|nr:uncharacterized protein BT62DRAFT_919926 [Guyanagaster necrorhizus MCA 3950]KAG7446691.1 hypothetical protein BT62DRAFT_919926 [Guyanagaster necrorhizus MCA 3950]